MRADKLTNKLRDAFISAQNYATSKGNQEITPLHIFYCLLVQESGLIPTIIGRLINSLNLLTTSINLQINKLPTQKGSNSSNYSKESITLIEQAEFVCKSMADDYISVEHILLAATKNVGVGWINEKLMSLDITEEKVMKILKEIRGANKIVDKEPEGKYMALEKYTRDLTKIAREGKMDPVIGRNEEIRRAIQVLSRRQKNNPVLIGDPGVGKTAIIEGIAQRIVNNDVPESLKNKRILVLDLGGMLAGAKHRGDFEERMKSVVTEISNTNGEIILFIDELHTLVGSGGAEGTGDAANMLKPALARGHLRCLGATTLDEYRKYIEKDKALERRFQPVYVNEPTTTDAISILRGIKEKYELHHGIKIKDSALIAAVNLSDRYIADRQLPDKAIDLIDEAAAKLKMELESMPTYIEQIDRQIFSWRLELGTIKKDDEDSEEAHKLEQAIADLQEESKEVKANWQAEKEILANIRSLTSSLADLKVQSEEAQRKVNLELAAQLIHGTIPEYEANLKMMNEKLVELKKKGSLIREEVTEEDIASVVAKWTGIPVEKMIEGEAQKLLGMENNIKKKVIGQEKAIKAICSAVKRAKTGVQDPNRPIGSFLFLGPTGVGKTEISKALAEVLLNSADNMIRLDMSEYMEKHAIARLIGAPPGYIGYEEGGKLTEAVRRKPYSVILFDEVEKAHPDVFNLLLQVLDDGRLTDSKGRTVNFCNTIIILTSNAGAKFIQEAEDLEDPKVMDEINKALGMFFRPEFLNRLDEKIIFHRLEKEHIRKIVNIQLNKVVKLLAEKKIQLEFTEEAMDKLAEEGFDPVFGARPLKRVIQREVQDQLADNMLEEKFGAGKKVLVDLEEDKIVCKVVE